MPCSLAPQRVSQILVSYGPPVTIAISEAQVGFLAPIYFHQLGFDVALIGTLMSVAAVGSVASSLPSGLLYRPDRAKAFMLGSLAVAAVIATLYPLASEPGSLALVRFAWGFAVGVASTLNLALFIEAQPLGHSRSTALGYYGGSMALGFASGNLVAGYVAETFGLGSAFMVAAFSALLALGLAAPSRSPSFSAPPASSAGNWVERLFRPLAAAAGQPRLITVALVAFFLNAVHHVVGAFFPLYALQAGLSLGEIGLARSGYAAVNAVGRPLAGHLMSRFDHRKLANLGMVAHAAMVMAVPASAHLAFLLPVLVAGGAARAISSVAITIGLAEDVDERHVSRGMASAVFTAARESGSIAGPLLAGLIGTVTGVAGLFLVAPPLFAGAFALSLLVTRHPPLAARSSGRKPAKA